MKYKKMELDMIINCLKSLFDASGGEYVFTTHDIKAINPSYLSLSFNIVFEYNEKVLDAYYKSALSRNFEITETIWS